MNSRLRDMSPAVDLTQRRSVGPKRVSHPDYVDLLPPCNNACPAGENIQAWLGLAQAGKTRAAWEALIRDNPMPAVHGRVCYHPCEDACNRGALDHSVSIHAVERFLGDTARAEGWPVAIAARPSGRRVLVVGAGPGGLSAAYHLTRLGHQAEVHEAEPVAGGMLNFGIPAYRLPRDVLQQEIATIERAGVRIVLDHKIDDLAAAKKAGDFDAVFVAIGAQAARRVDIPARDADHVLTAVNLLHAVDAGKAPKLGRRVAIYGAGDTAMDVARTAKRLGAEEPLIIFFSDRAHMEAHAFEAAEAIGEGVKIKWLSSIREIGAGELKVEQMALDAKGVPQPTGRFETLQADSVVLALGQQAESGFLRDVAGIALQPDGTVVVGPDMMTGAQGIYAGGDLVGGARTVTTAVGHGKRAARHIDAWLRGTARTDAPKHRVVTFADLHLPIYSDAAPSVQREVPPGLRQGFAEVTAGLSDAEALHEARRCLSCGNCFECDNCLAACPEDAIIKLGPGRGYRVDLDRCTGCAVCYEQCPCHAIDMTPDGAAEAQEIRRS